MRTMEAPSNWFEVKILRRYVRQKIGFLIDDYVLVGPIVEWLRTCKGKWYFDEWNGNYIKFENAHEATICKLMWAHE